MRNTFSSDPARAKDRGRKARLAKALRENLKRRKAQLREREEARYQTNRDPTDDESDESEQR